MTQKTPKVILGIESSCDDTCAAIVVEGRKVLSSIVSSQEIHKKFGGIVPELAARKHVENIPHVISLALQEAKLEYKNIEGITVTNRYGLASSLLVGVAMAKSLAYALDLPLVGVHHVEGHLYANFLEHEIEFPHISLTAAGGHTILMIVREAFQYEVLGQTTDDAVGEAYDKVARQLGLGFPGGPIIDRIAKENKDTPASFTSPMLNSGDYQFSFSGIKTAVRYYVEKIDDEKLKTQIPAIADGFQRAVIKVLVEKSLKAAKEYNCKSITLSGGVAANSFLRSELNKIATEEGIKLYYPSLRFCTDNAAMVAGLGYHKFLKGERADFSLDVKPNAYLIPKISEKSN